MNTFQHAASRRLHAIAVGTLMVAASLFTADVALSAPQLLPGVTPKARMTVKPLQVLPAPTGNPQPFRQTKIGNCSAPSTVPNRCRFVFERVDSNRLLEIANVTCATVLPQEGDIAYFVLTTSMIFNAEIFDKVVAWIPGTEIDGSAVLSNVSGPYYFKARQRPVIWGAGIPDVGASCTISGSLSRTD